MAPAPSDRTFVLITYQFPYLPGEYFIEGEIEHLTNAYGTVLVLPIRRAWSLRTFNKRDISPTFRLVDPGTGILTFFVSLLGALLEAPLLVWRHRSQWSGLSGLPDSSLAKWLVSGIKVSLAKSAIRRCFPVNAHHYIFCSYWRLEAAAALALLKADGTVHDFFSRAHGGDIYIDRRYPFESLIHEQANAIFPVSDSGSAFLVKTKGFSGRNVNVQRLGIRLPKGVNAPSLDGVIRVVTCSDIIPIKRVPLIARFIAQIPGEVEWVHFGDGNEIRLVKHEISFFADSHHANLMGRVANSAIHDFYAHNPIDLFINLSETEGVPVSIMEALGHGIPVLATDVGGTAEIVDNACGHLLPKDCDSAVFLLGVRRLLSPESRLEFRKRARQKAELLCDAKVNYKNTCDLMKELAGGSRQPINI